MPVQEELNRHPQGRSGAKIVTQPVIGDEQMDLVKLSNRVTRTLDDAIPADLSDADRAAILKIVGKALLDASAQPHEECKEAAKICCGPEADLAHKIQEQMDKKRAMLIANLSSMR